MNAIIDTDGGVDDFLALVLALRSPQLNVKAVTTTGGNVAVGKAARNAAIAVRSIRQQASRPVIACGAARPMRNPQFDNSAQVSYSAEGITLPDRYFQHDIDLLSIKDSAVDVLHSFCSQERITLITLGPLTNLAWLRRRDEAVARNIEQVIIMGGAIDAPGNMPFDLGGRIERFAEFNIQSDPEAAADVFSWLGPKIILVPKNACDRVILSTHQVRNFLQDERDTSHELMRSWLAYRDQRHLKPIDFTLYDPLTVAVAVEPGLVTQERMSIVVDTTDEPKRGQTRRSHAGPVVNVVTEVKVREAEEFIWRGTFNKAYPGEPAP